MKVRLERLETMRAVYVHVLSDTPEEDAWREIVDWARSRGILEKCPDSRLFGRNTYPTDKPEPHGYELYLTIGPDVEPDGEVKIGEIPGGLYAVLGFRNLHKIGEAWQQMWSWMKESEHEHVGWKRGEHGWVDGFEEPLDWIEEKPQTEWSFDLWVKLKEP